MAYPLAAPVPPLETVDSLPLLDPRETKRDFELVPPPDAPGVDRSWATSFETSGEGPRRRRILAAFQRLHLPRKRLTTFAECGSHPWVAEICDPSPRYVVVSNRCRDRFCGTCARIKSSTIAENLERHVDGRTLRFITFTLKAGPMSLSRMITQLYDSFRRLRQNKVWARTQRGGASFLEVKIGSGSGQWHPHLHVLCEGKYVRVHDLRDAWNRITGGSHQVWIELVRDRKKMARYVTKYVSKPFDPAAIRSDDKLDELLIAMSGTHSALTFGTWRGIRLCKTVHDHQYTFIASVEVLQYRVWARDHDAIVIWNRLCETYDRLDRRKTLPPSTRAPPPPTRLPVMTLFDLTPHSWQRGL